MDLTKYLYHITRSFPSEEKYGLISQIRRSALSIPSNIAEGCVRSGSKEFQQFLAISLGSAAELKTQIILSYEIGFLAKDEYEKIKGDISEIERLLRSLKKSIT